MIIDIEEITNILTSKKIKIIGCIHVGSQSYIEDDIYKRLGIETANIAWIDAHPQISKISQISQKSITLDTLFTPLKIKNETKPYLFLLYNYNEA